MKNRIITSVISTVAVVLMSTGCKKYVDKALPDQFDDNTFWISEDNVRSYNWGFYELFPGYGNLTTYGDFYFSSFTDDQAGSAFQNFLLNVPATATSWDFTQIRKANIMLERIDRVPMSDEAKNHWKGVARFFRALTYFNRVKDYGDLPWLGNSMDISDEGMIYKPRDSRVLVMDSVLADINFAVDNLRTKDQPNTITRDVALALKSRIGLYEGTWRRYHTDPALPDAAKFLAAAKDAASKLMTGTYKLSADYRTAYNSIDLSGNQEIILYKKYLPGFLTHSVIGFNTNSTQMAGLTKSAVESYLCSDGLPITVSPLYKGDSSIQRTRSNRDRRLLQTIDTFLCYNGELVGGMSTSTGYRPAKFLQPLVANTLAPYNDTDAPLFWLAEVLLNYAEAAAELQKEGQYAFSQTDLDRSINLLRVRAGLPPLQYLSETQVAANGVPYTDSKKDPDVPSFIWEIRRERRAELMMDGFRYHDLMRWSKGDYMDSNKNPDIFKGARVKGNADVLRDEKGYITPYKASTVRKFETPKNYLLPIPSGQIALYPNGALKQNPRW
ncbi:RagB/SusD family nutrient uptake outer membrane protein [Chitinophaga nivalis]|uniref:RagB/SusD family nutrient uptake outer membrane protein n=1 Tax=Chitinophaga nivalis TaxID=2991709 RepID=A0ABT3IR61_9BACT|nr:RagB/SusD family nutrient uptake outer membrane protein [Chitinophaga nivalis]MCW3463870.1 RagB/SusD family nutrient uptake outer membrane protein [Chitinophaga nivalis]MCW3486440.1 RagB/SusD family nutrient uptake outer membrane protein [Chitinophaga nivalis]